MFRRRNKADAESADAPSEEGHAQLEEPHASFEHARGSDSFDERPADAPAPVTASATLPVDDAHWELPAERWQPDDDFLRYSEEAFRAVASGGTEAPSSYGSAGYASEGFGGDAASPFGPVSDPFGSMAANASTPDDQALQPSVSSPAPVAPAAVASAAAIPAVAASSTATALLEPPAPQTPAPSPPTATATEPAPVATPDVAADAANDAAHEAEPTSEPGAPTPEAPVEAAPTTATEPANALPVRLDRPHLPPDLLRLKLTAQDALVERMGARLYDRTLLDDQIEHLVTTELTSFLAERGAEIDDDNRLLLSEEIINDLLRHGPIEPYLQDDSVSEVMVNGLTTIYVERNGKLQETSSNFATEAHLRQVIERIVSKVGRRIDESSPMVDARLPDGSRVNAVIPPLAVDGPSLTIRKFAKDALGVDDLVRFRTLDRQSVEFLAACVRGRLNVLVSGGTGTGKTTLLNILSSFIPDDERIVTIEDAVELQLHQRHVVRLESRPANVEGKGQVMIRDLVRNSLRMRPDRVIIGECRGGEALDMLQAMNTGHDGSLSTLHSNGPRDALSRLETLCLMAGMDLPMRAIREQIASAVHLIVHVARLRDGSRRVTHITEVVGLEGEVITLSDIFTFDFDAGFDEEGHYMGTLQPTGLIPGIVRKLEEHGVRISNDLFDTGEEW